MTKIVAVLALLVLYDGTPPPPPYADRGDTICTLIPQARPNALLVCVAHDVNVTFCVFDETRTACTALPGAAQPAIEGG